MKSYFLRPLFGAVLLGNLFACGTKPSSGVSDVKKGINSGIKNTKCLLGVCPDDQAGKPGIAGAPAPAPAELSLTTYTSCDELQTEVKAQLLAKAINDQQRAAYIQSRANTAGSKNNQVAQQKSLEDSDSYESESSNDAAVPMSANMGGSVGAVAAATSAAGASSTSASNNTKSGTFTNVQVKGVDEADFVKVGNNHIYVARAGGIEVINRKDLRQLGKIPLDRVGAATKTLYVDGDNLLVISQTTRQTTHCPARMPQPLPTSCEDGPLGAGIGLTCQPALPPGCTTISKPVTLVRHYAAALNAVPGLVREREFTGSLLDTRLSEGRLVLIFRDELAVRPFATLQVAGPARWQGNAWIMQAGSFASNNQSIVAEPVLVDSRIDAPGDSIAGIKCTTIAKPVLTDLDFRLTKVISLSASNTADEQSLGVLGGGDHVYMTTKNLYIAKQGQRWQPWQPAPGVPLPAVAAPAIGGPIVAAPLVVIPDDANERLTIKKIALNTDGRLALTAAGEVTGTINDRWAFKEFEDGRVFAVVTTTRQPLANRGPVPVPAGTAVPQPGTRISVGNGKHHHLWILSPVGRSLQLINEMHGFGDGEDIRAIRYLGCIAYVVTYPTVMPHEVPIYQEDPLFAFDFTDPARPKLLSELKVPGFSAYLHPVEAGRLLGVGYDTDSRAQWTVATGVQVSLFDTSDLYNVVRSDNHVLGGPGSRSLLVPEVRANVVIDAHAFYYDPVRRLIGVPVVLAASNDGQAAFSGAVLLRLEANALSEVARISHAALSGAPAPSVSPRVRAASEDIARLYTIDDRLVSVSQFGIASHDWDNPNVMKSQTAFWP